MRGLLYVADTRLLDIYYRVSFCFLFPFAIDYSIIFFGTHIIMIGFWFLVFSFQFSVFRERFETRSLSLCTVLLYVRQATVPYGRTLLSTFYYILALYST